MSGMSYVARFGVDGCSPRRRQLVWLDRHDNQRRTRLARTLLSEAENNEFMHWVNGQLSRLQHALERRKYCVVGTVPADADVVGLLGERLPSHRRDWQIANRPGLVRE